MKTKLIGWIIFLALTACNTENNATDKAQVAIDSLRQNDWEKGNLKAKVKSKEVHVYAALSGTGDAAKGQLKNIQLTTYNEQGNELEITQYNDKKEIAFTWKNVYDNDGNCVEKVYNDGHITRKLTYIYNDKKLCTEASEYIDGTLAKTTTFLYNELGQEVESNEKFVGQTIQSKLASKYDEKDKLRETVTYDEKGALSLKQLFTYDAAGYLSQHSILGGDHAPVYKRMYQYDQYGNKTQDFGFGGDSELMMNDCFKYMYQYDDKGNWIIRKTNNYHDAIQEIAEQKIVYYE